MNHRTLYLALTIALLTLFLMPQASQAQKFADSVKWRIYFTGFDSANPSGHAFAMIGYHTLARYGLPYDTLYNFTDRWIETLAQSDTERDWPPNPPVEDIRLNNVTSALPSNQYHILHPYTGSTEIDTFRLIWLSGDGQGISKP